MFFFAKKFTPLQNPSSWRRLSIATWNSPNDPTVYGNLSVDFTKARKYLETINASGPSRVTITHLVAKTMALTLARYPDLNGIIRWKKIYLRKSVDLFMQVSVEATTPEEKPDLSGAKIENCDCKSIGEIADELRKTSGQIRKKEDPLFKRNLNLQKLIPDFLLTPLIRLFGFIIFNLGIAIPALGLPEDPFGSAMITSVGMWNMPPGFAPLVPMSRVPLIICVGEVTDKAWVIDGQLAVRPILELTVTFDHRFMDGFTGAKMAKYFKSLLEDPATHLDDKGQLKNAG